MIRPLLKPKDRKRIPAPPYTIMRDGRIVCSPTKAGRREYRKRTLEVWARDKGICGWCLTPVSEEEVTADHMQSRGHGGGKRDDRRENLRPCHQLCNSERGSSPILTRSEWLAWKANKSQKAA